MQDILDRTSTADLRKAVERADKKIAAIQAQVSIENLSSVADDFDGPFPPFKDFERWLGRLDAALRQEVASLHRVREQFRTEIDRREKLSLATS